MKRIKVGICQMAVEDDKRFNLVKAAHMIGQAAKSGCHLAVLPEMFNCPYQAELFPEYAEAYPHGPSIQMLAETAARHKILVIGGSIPERDEAGRIYNTSFSFDEQGNLLGRHRKVHLFDVDIKSGTTFQESKTLTAGRDITVINTAQLCFGVAICYDIRFSRLAREMTLQNADLLVYPAAFGPVTGPAHWELLLRSRAVDNQVFVIGAAPAKNPAAEYQAYGHSMLVDPWGRIIAAAEEAETLLTGEIDAAVTAKIREELPILKHWREEIFAKK